MCTMCCDGDFESMCVLQKMERIRARHGGNEQAVQGLKVEIVVVEMVVVMRVKIRVVEMGLVSVMSMFKS